jgi:hypothetical protein
MSDLKQLRHLEEITRITYQHAQAGFQQVVAQENRLRGEMRRIGVLDKETRSLSPQNNSMKAIGADVLWQGWIGRSKAQINLQLARVLAIKEHHLDAVRKSYGKLLVVQELLANQQAAARKARSKAQLAGITSQTVLASVTQNPDTGSARPGTLWNQPLSISDERRVRVRDGALMP